MRVFNEFGVPDQSIQDKLHAWGRQLAEYLESLVDQGVSLGDIRGIGSMAMQEVNLCISECVLTRSNFMATSNRLKHRQEQLQQIEQQLQQLRTEDHTNPRIPLLEHQADAIKRLIASHERSIASRGRTPVIRGRTPIKGE